MYTESIKCCDSILPALPARVYNNVEMIENPCPGSPIEPIDSAFKCCHIASRRSLHASTVNIFNHRVGACIFWHYGCRISPYGRNGKDGITGLLESGRHGTNRYRLAPKKVTILGHIF